ncbi:MAG: type II toxin-antitoxin system VapB family antitoxin [Trueperaceae bacterium]|nr:MAG: type II toxin-antitoxin system VapB family antitoxin [Trueperaceae bacterium]
MKQTSIKSDRVADLLEKIVNYTGESKVDAVTVALERRLKDLERRNRAECTLAWLEAGDWSSLPEESKGKALTKGEQEELLGF